MSHGKPVQDGVRVKLAKGMSWGKLATLSPQEIRDDKLWPAGFLPMPHPHHEAGGLVFPKSLIEETKQQTDRDLTRFELAFDLPDHFLLEFPAPIYLTMRSDVGDVSPGKLVTLGNFNKLFQGILNPKQLEGLRLLVTPFPQQQFNADRSSLKAHAGVACFDCHANGHTPPYYTDNLMHNLKVERFFKEVTINGSTASADGPIKTFPLRGIKDSPPYLHDGRLLTLEDTVEFFNLVAGIKTECSG